MMSEIRNTVADAALKFKDNTLTLCRDHPVWTGALAFSSAVALLMYRRRPKTKILTLSEGSWVEPGFEEVYRVFEENLKSGLDRGGSFAAYHKGKLVVNLFGGYSDEEATTTWKQDTVSINFSATKFTNAIVAAILIDRGHLSLDAPVTKYWPEFGQHGKEEVTVGQLLSHQAGCPFLTQEWKLSYILDDIDKFADILASQKPLWKPGSAVGYHLITIGEYFEQVVRRADPKGRGCQQFFKEEITDPLGIEYWIGLPLSETYKAARVYLNYMRGWNSVPPKEYFRFAWKEKTCKYKAWSRFQASDWSFARVNDPLFRMIPDSSIQGYCSALSVAKLCSNLASTSPDPQLISQESVERMATPLIPPGVEDIHFHSKIRWGPGSFIVECKCGDKPFNIFGGLSYGGPMHVVDRHFQLGFAYVTNYLNPYSVMVVDPRYKRLKNALYNCVRKLENIKEPITGDFLEN